MGAYTLQILLQGPMAFRLKELVKFVLCSSFSKSWRYRMDQFENFFNVIILNYCTLPVP